ncbi:MAG: class I SAM-dependent methyltransferase [Chloroflexota bacterium]
MNQSWQKFNDEGRKQWDRKAVFWDELHSDEGNSFHRHLIGPAIEKLLALNSGERVLDIACGSGVLARRLAALGGQVTAVDFSEGLLKQAQKRTQESGEPISYKIVDATDEEALVALGVGMYDAIISTMALMDMPIIAPLFRAVSQLLKPAGRFVFATSHPAFHSNVPTLIGERVEENGVLETHHYLKISGYLDIPPMQAVGARGEPTPHNVYHRPLHALLGAGFSAGLVLDGLEEPSFDPETADAARPLSWDHLWQFPPVIVGRMRIK